MSTPSPDDIADMKAKGCDAWTIAEAERRLERWNQAQVVCHAIETSFAGVKLGGGVGLWQAQGIDDYADAGTCAAYRAKDEKEDWRRIPTKALRDCNSSLSFFDAEGMRFHLPAYLTADLHGEYGFGMAFCLAYLSDHSIGKFALLSPPQRAAVRLFLLHILDDRDHKLDQPHIERALAEYWTEGV